MQRLVQIYVYQGYWRFCDCDKCKKQKRIFCRIKYLSYADGRCYINISSWYEKKGGKNVVYVKSKTIK